MNKEKALKIQRWYDYFRLAVVIIVVGLLAYFTLLIN